MTALNRSSHGTTETAAAYSEAAYIVAVGKGGGVAAYSLSILQAIADGDQPLHDETPQQYAQRHLGVLQNLGYIEQKNEVPA